MRKLPSIMLSLLMACHSALAVGLCGCIEGDGPRAQDSHAGQDPTSLGVAQQLGVGVTASLTNAHHHEDECNHAAPDTAKPPRVAKRSKPLVAAVSAPVFRALTQWFAGGNTEALSASGAGNYCEHHWLISVRSIILHL